MKILFLGDIVGKLGRKTVAKVLPSLRKRVGADLVFANAENIAHGRGASRSKIEEVRALGVDYFTSGNHIFWQEGFKEEIDNLPVLRPANYEGAVPGKGSVEIPVPGKGKVLLINLQGKTFFKDPVNCPFKTGDEILLGHERKDFSAIIVDFHAEVTSEKVAFGWYLDGRVGAVVGTHTHVPTADTWILPLGTAYVSDVGMVGPLHSVLGVKKEIIIKRFIDPVPERFEWVENGPAVFNSVLIEFGALGRAKSIKRFDKVVE